MFQGSYIHNVRILISESEPSASRMAPSLGLTNQDGEVHSLSRFCDRYPD